MPPVVVQKSETKFKAYIEGGPALAAKLQALDKKIRNEIAKDAVTAGGRIIADEWADYVPIGEPPHDPHPGAYRDSLRSFDAVKVRATVNGASATIRPAVLGLPENQQPRLYAGKLEFGDGNYEAQPSARPAFDSSQDLVLSTMSDMLKKALP